MRLTRIFSIWSLTLLLLSGASMLHAQEIDDTEPASGTVFYLSGGTGSGTVHLFTGQQLLRLEYSDSYVDRSFALGEEFQYGAIWQVRYQRLQDGTLRLQQVVNTGQIDLPVRAADSLVRLHYRQLASGDYRNAYRNLHPDYRAVMPFEAFTAGFGGATFITPNLSGQGIKVVGRSDASVQLLVDMSYFVQGETRFFRFDIQQVDGLWYIGPTAEVTFNDWQRA